MKTKNYYFILFGGLMMFLLYVNPFSAGAFNATKSVLVGDGTISLYRDGKNVLPTTDLAAGDTVIVYAFPSDNESLTFLMIGENIYYSSPVLVKVTGNVDVQAGFEAKRIIFKETFGLSDTYFINLGGGEAAGAYTGYDTSSDVAEISTINGQTSNSKIHNLARNTNDLNYNPDSIDNPNSTHVYLQASNLAVRFAEGKELTGENMQIKFRYLPVQSSESNLYYNYSGLQVKLNNTAFTPLEYANEVSMRVFWNNADNPDDPESAHLTGITSPHRAPFVVFPVPENYTSISSILITQSQQTAPFNNRGRLDDLIVVADGDPSGLAGQSLLPSIYAVVTDADIEFRGDLKTGDEISIRNLVSGSAVKTCMVNSDRVLIPTVNLPAGVYIATVRDSHGELNSFKVIIK